MSKRKLVGLAVIALAAALSPITDAAEVKYTAAVFGTRLEPNASGRAVWMSRPDEVHFSIEVRSVSVDGLAFVYVDAELTGVLDIIRGESRIESKLQKSTSRELPRIRPGSKVRVYSSDNELIMEGVFRSK